MTGIFSLAFSSLSGPENQGRLNMTWSNSVEKKSSKINSFSVNKLTLRKVATS